MPDKVKLTLSNPYVDPDGKVHDVGSTVTVPADVAERLTIGGIGAPATTEAKK